MRNREPKPIKVWLYKDRSEDRKEDAIQYDRFTSCFYAVEEATIMSDQFTFRWYVENDDRYKKFRLTKKHA